MCYQLNSRKVACQSVKNWPSSINQVDNTSELRHSATSLSQVIVKLCLQHDSHAGQLAIADTYLKKSFCIGWMPFLTPNQQCQSKKDNYQLSLTDHATESCCRQSSTITAINYSGRVSRRYCQLSWLMVVQFITLWVSTFLKLKMITHFNDAVAKLCLQCFDAVGWAAERASGL